MPHRLTGAIIAAGRGERLRPATAGLPKPLVELGGKTLLVRQIELMQRMGITRVDVIVNSETAALLEQRELTLPPGTELCVADPPTSMESLLMLGKRIPAGRFLLATVDTVVSEADFRYFFDQAESINSSITHEALAGGPERFDGALGVVKWRGDERPLFVEVTADGLITRCGDESAALVTAGLYCFSTRIFEYADEARAAGLPALRRFLAFLLDQGLRFAAVELSGALDIDDGADLALARAMVAGRRANGASG